MTPKTHACPNCGKPILIEWATEQTEREVACNWCYAEDWSQETAPLLDDKGNQRFKRRINPETREAEDVLVVDPDTGEAAKLPLVVQTKHVFASRGFKGTIRRGPD